MTAVKQTAFCFAASVQHGAEKQPVGKTYSLRQLTLSMAKALRYIKLKLFIVQLGAVTAAYMWTQGPNSVKIRKHFVLVL